MNDLRRGASILAVEFVWYATGVLLRQMGYVKEVLMSCCLDSCKLISIPMLLQHDWKKNGDPRLNHSEITRYQQGIGIVMFICTRKRLYFVDALDVMCCRSS